MRTRETLARDMFIGTLSRDYTGYKRNDARLYVDAELRIWEGDAGETRATVNHGRITRSVSPAISAGYRYRPHQDYRSCGQIREALDHIVSYAPGWNARKVRRLAKIWDTYHLADMRAGCKHTSAGETCPKGYRHGHAWLTQTTPAAIISELREMFGGKLPDEIPWS